MDFTREPIIESVITPKEGCKLVVRSSKSASQEEFFVDSVEVVSFGHSLYYRSQERPKSFFVPANDYEILEVRETRMVLKNVGVDRTIKIGGGREMRKEKEKEREEAPAMEPAAAAESSDARGDKKRDKRRHTRRRRSKGEPLPAEEAKEEAEEPVASEEPLEEKPAVPRPSRSALLPPPSTLISETIARYKDNALFKDAFFLKDEDEMGLEETPEVELTETTVAFVEGNEGEEFPSVSLPQPEYGSFELTEEEEEEIYRQRQKYKSQGGEELPEYDDEHEPPKISDDLIGNSSDEKIESNGNYTNP